MQKIEKWLRELGNDVVTLSVADGSLKLSGDVTRLRPAECGHPCHCDGYCGKGCASCGEDVPEDINECDGRCHAEVPYKETIELRAPIHPYAAPETELWSTCVSMISEDVWSSGVNHKDYFTWAINPDRLAQMKRIKGQADNPIDFRMASFESLGIDTAWQFLLGPSIRGVIIPMDRGLLRKAEKIIWT